jgi:hypothetical protein
MVRPWNRTPPTEPCPLARDLRPPSRRSDHSDRTPARATPIPNTMKPHRPSPASAAGPPVSPEPVHTQVHTRLAARLAGALNESAQLLPHDLGERLRVARERALDRARQAQRAARAGTFAAGRGQAAAWAAAVAVRGAGAGDPRATGPNGWQRALAMLPLAALVAGLWAIAQLHDHEQVLSSADIDLVLLADDLPPAAYVDPGFAEFLRRDPP